MNRSFDTNIFNSTSSIESDIVFNVIRSLVYTLITLLILLGNTLCLLVLERIKSMPESTKILLISLTISDLGIGLFVVLPLIGSAYLDDWPYSPGFCLLQAFLVELFTNVGLFTVTAVSLERYLAVSQPFRFPGVLTRVRSLVAVVALWVLSMVQPIILGLGSNWSPRFDTSYELCRYVEEGLASEFFLYTSVSLLVFIPYVLTLILYYRLVKIANHHAARIFAVVSGPNDTAVDQSSRKKPRASRINTKAAKTFLVIMCAFGLAWGPVIVVEILRTFLGSALQDTLNSLGL